MNEPSYVVAYIPENTAAEGKLHQLAVTREDRPRSYTGFARKVGKLGDQKVYRLRVYDGVGRAVEDERSAYTLDGDRFVRLPDGAWSEPPAKTRPSGVSPAQLQVLAAVAAIPDASGGELAAVTGVDNASIGPLLARLLGRGLIAKDATRRPWRYRPTPEGLRVLRDNPAEGGNS